MSQGNVILFCNPSEWLRITEFLEGSPKPEVSQKRWIWCYS